MTTTEPLRDYGFLPEDMRAFIARTEGFAPPGEGIAAQRAGYDAMCAAFAVPHPAGLACADLTLGRRPCRRYRPARVVAGVTAVYFHGGGFVLGGLDSHDSVCADLADLAGVELIAVDYRLAPEHRHPAAYDDALAVVEAIAGPKLLVGDSAGGLLAAAVAADRPGVRGQVLIYPALGAIGEQPGARRHARAPLLSAADMEVYDRIYACPQDDPTGRPILSAGRAALPPSAIFAAECDPLAAQAALYARRLAEAGVPVHLSVEPGLVHGHLRARHVTRAGAAAFARIAAALAGLARAAAEEGAGANENGPRGGPFDTVAEVGAAQ